MPLHVPASLDGLLSLFSDCFTRPTLQTFRALVVGQISQTGRRTVTGMLVGARLSQVWDHCRAHRFFSRARWSPDALGLRLAQMIVERLIEPGTSVIIAVDDTLLHRLGAQGPWHLLASRRHRQCQRTLIRMGKQLGGCGDCRARALLRTGDLPAGHVSPVAATAQPSAQRARSSATLKARACTPDHRPDRRSACGSHRACGRRRRLRVAGVAWRRRAGQCDLPVAQRRGSFCTAERAHRQAWSPTHQGCAACGAFQARARPCHRVDAERDTALPNDQRTFGPRSAVRVAARAFGHPREVDHGRRSFARCRLRACASDDRS